MNAVLLSCLATAAVAFAEETRLHNWRCVANGGVNVLYCYLRCNGIPSEYHELLRSQAEEVGAEQTAATLIRLAAKNGMPLKLISLTMNELLSCNFPVITHMDGETLDAGAFLLILNMTDDTVYYVNGPTATIHAMHRDTFRRVWSGIALLPSSHSEQHVVACLAGFLVAVVLLLAFQFTRATRFK